MQRFPAGLLISIDTYDFEEFCEYAVGWSLDHQLIGQRKPHIKTDIVMTRSLQLGFVRHFTGYSCQGDNPKGTVSLAVSLDETRPIVHCGHGIDKLDLAVTLSGRGFEVVNRRGSRHLVASISQDLLEQYAADLWGESQVVTHSQDRLRFPDMAHRLAYLNACHRILDGVQRQPNLLADSRVASLLEQKLLENIVLQGCTNPRYANAPNRYQVARRAYRYLLEQLEEVPSIRKLCALTGASYATLERGFRETYGMAPQAHLKALRLSRARKELRCPNKDTTVTGVAMHWGFLELGRFAAQYKERFSESPSETLRKARGDSAVLAA